MKNVCIIGFGVSGMASARHCISKGYTIKILEKESNIGGVWLTKTYPHVRLQTTKHSYAFSDFPHFEGLGTMGCEPVSWDLQNNWTLVRP